MLSEQYAFSHREREASVDVRSGSATKDARESEAEAAVSAQ
jgi:hypothetical protein